jgi:hypothetical protein
MNRVSEEITSTFFAVPLPGNEPRPKTLPPLSSAR